jgi:beta-phosphoglucomutase-like phosphatase (HAD superfamily)
MIKCCIFDLDGTLLNTISTITHYVNRALGEHLIEGISEEECARITEENARRFFGI